MEGRHPSTTVLATSTGVIRARSPWGIGITGRVYIGTTVGAWLEGCGRSGIAAWHMLWFKLLLLLRTCLSWDGIFIRCSVVVD